MLSKEDVENALDSVIEFSLNKIVDELGVLALSKNKKQELGKTIEIINSVLMEDKKRKEKMKTAVKKKGKTLTRLFREFGLKI